MVARTAAAAGSSERPRQALVPCCVPCCPGVEHAAPPVDPHGWVQRRALRGADGTSRRPRALGPPSLVWGGTAGDACAAV